MRHTLLSTHGAREVVRFAVSLVQRNVRPTTSEPAVPPVIVHEVLPLYRIVRSDCPDFVNVRNAGDHDAAIGAENGLFSQCEENVIAVRR